jgi:hypothetical protein
MFFAKGNEMSAQCPYCGNDLDPDMVMLMDMRAHISRIERQVLVCVQALKVISDSTEIRVSQKQAKAALRAMSEV